MTKYQHILVALDLKPEDDETITKQAQLLANAYGAKLSVIHVIEPIYTYGIPPGAEFQIQDWENKLEESASQKMQQVSQKLNIPKNQQILLVGSPRSTILNIAEKIGADLIVVGHHGRHGIKSLIMGNTADDMVHRAKCDVLAVHV